jgi:16S rRNA (guanine1207-N2)-methyltransferase
LASAISDPALEVLFLPFAHNVLPQSGTESLFLRARGGGAMQRMETGSLLCEQSFKPAADVLQQQGFRTVADVDASPKRYPHVLVLPPRQREEARALFARAVTLAAPGGRVIASIENNEGAKAGEGDLKRLAGLGGSLSKHHCRVFWTGPIGDGDHALLAQWRELDAPRPILQGRYVSRPGVFSWNRIDPASALLARNLPTTLGGDGADLGTGFGYLADEVLTRCPGVRSLDVYEAESRALALARINLSRHSQRVQLQYHWADVTSGLDRAYDFIVSNPPFHSQGRDGRPDIGQGFIAAAAAALMRGGRLWLVANKHLPYEDVLKQRFSDIRLVDMDQGFKVIEAIKAGPR